MTRDDIAVMLRALRSPQGCNAAWLDFLGAYGGVLYQTAKICASNDEAAAESFIFICEQLARDRFRRLLKFRPEGAASFVTWLRVVARNLCYDWHRAQAGRPRPFAFLKHLSALEVEVYNLRFGQGVSLEAAAEILRPEFPDVGITELSTIELKLQQSMRPRQRWVLANRRDPNPSLRIAGSERCNSEEVEIADPRPDPEALATAHEVNALLRASILSLDAQEQLILQLRFEQDLSLEEIARVCGLQDAQRVHRTIAAILKKLRVALESQPVKMKPVSVK